MNYDRLRQDLDLTNIRSICRLCLATGGEMFDLFFTGDDRLIDMVVQCTSIQMIPANGIVSSVCFRCKLRLEDLSNFKEQCVRCEEIFQSKIDKMETIEVVPDIFGMHSEDDENDECFTVEPVEPSIKTEEVTWNDPLDVEDAVSLSGGAFLIKSSEPEEITDEIKPEKHYTISPPDGIDLKALVVYLKGKKHWKCPYCDKVFNQSGNLKAHINTHTGYKPYTCTLCQRSFAQKSNLNYHMKASHDPERPFKCNSCDRAFAAMDQMVTHIRSKHSQPEPPQRPVAPKRHNCPFCGKGFAQGFNLRLHMNTHTGERPYKCQHCERSFTQRSNLNVHMNKNHPEVRNMLQQA